MTTPTSTVEVDLDRDLANRYGGYASYRGENEPVYDHYGDNPANEVDRLLDIFATPERRALDIGCGAGFTLCRLAPHVAEIWGIDQDEALLAAARQRVLKRSLANATLLAGNVAVADDMRGLPDDAFDVLFSRRGPDVTAGMLHAIKADAVIVQELVRGTLGVKPLFGREPFAPAVGSTPHPLIEYYAGFGFVPVSVKDYFYDAFFRDAAHLVHDLKGKLLWHWTMPDYPYDEARDRSALDLYVRYNTTSRGIRVTHHRSVYLFRRAEMPRFPAIPDAKPLYPGY